MKREIQVHFDNGGQVSWQTDIDDEKDWLENFWCKKHCCASDEASGRSISFPIKNVNAVLLTQPQQDPIERLYAANQG
jgi:hypothetical protein